MLYRIAIFSKYRDTSIYRYVSHITKHHPCNNIPQRFQSMWYEDCDMRMRYEDCDKIRLYSFYICNTIQKPLTITVIQTPSLSVECLNYKSYE